jgi:hypothetical protein
MTENQLSIERKIGLAPGLPEAREGKPFTVRLGEKAHPASFERASIIHIFNVQRAIKST